MLIVEIATLSRSGLLGLAVGALVLLLPYRGYLLPRVGADRVGLSGRARGARCRGRDALPLLLPGRDPLADPDGPCARSRRTSRSTASSLKILHQPPSLLGLGLNNFSIYYQQVTGKTNWGPHSYYVALIVETGITGTVLFCALPALGVRASSRRPASSEKCAGAGRGTRLRPACVRSPRAGRRRSREPWPLNFFYLTMQFYYVYVFLTLALAFPLVFGKAEPARRAVRAAASALTPARAT